LRLRRHRNRHQQHDQSKHFHLLWYDMKCVSTLDFCTYFLECISDEVVSTRLFGFHNEFVSIDGTTVTLVC
jgi:hypothetical protein